MRINFEIFLTAINKKKPFNSLKRKDLLYFMYFSLKISPRGGREKREREKRVSEKSERKKPERGRITRERGGALAIS